MFEKEIICNTNSCSIISSRKEINFQFDSDNYILIFNDDRSEKDHGFILRNLNENPIDEYLLRCLMIYFGEDIIHNDKIDTFYSFTRGTFNVSEEILIGIINKFDNFPYKSYPLWKKRLAIQAIQYYEYAVTGGIKMMPVNVGFFAMSIECIANAYYGKNDKYYTLGNNYINNLILQRLKRYKMNSNYRRSAKDFEKRLQTEIDILRELRNFYYGHSFSHLKDERTNLVLKLKEWALQYGLNPLLANAYYKENKLEWALHMQKHNLYSLGLRINRIMLFYLLGYARNIPFSSHDFSLVGESMKGKTYKQSNGVTITVK